MGVFSFFSGLLGFGGVPTANISLNSTNSTNSKNKRNTMNSRKNTMNAMIYEEDASGQSKNSINVKQQNAISQEIIKSNRNNRINATGLSKNSMNATKQNNMVQEMIGGASTKSKRRTARNRTNKKNRKR